MFEAVLAIVTRVSRWPVLWLLLAMYGVFAFVLMPMLINLPGMPAEAAPPLDLLFSYSPATAYAHIDSLGDTGRKLSTTLHLTLDVAYPIVYSLLFAVILSMCLRFVMLSDRWKRRTKWLPLLPFLILDFDLLENFGISFMALSWPNQSEWIARLTSFATSAKWSLVALTLGLVVLLIGTVVVKKASHKPRRNA